MADEPQPGDDRPVVSLDTRGQPHGASEIHHPRREPTRQRTRSWVRTTIVVVVAVAAIAAVAAWSLRFRAPATSGRREGTAALGHVYDLPLDPVTGALMAGARDLRLLGHRRGRSALAAT